MAVGTEIKVGGNRLVLSNLDKVLYPKSGFNKTQVIDYYTRVASVILPHLKDRPLTLKRYPNGVEKEFFYEKRCPTFRPRWVKTAPIYSKANDETISYCVINNLATLVWVANLAAIELHTSLARMANAERPTMMVFDLDPGSGADIVNCAEVAFLVRKILARCELASFAKTSGSKGLQLYVPLNTPVTFEETKQFARSIADRLASEHPDKVVAQMSKQLRTGKVFIDWSQNDRHKTTVCAYSLRAKDYPTVSTPVEWGEVENSLKSRAARPLSFEAADVLKRVEKRGDLFGPVAKLKQRLPEIPEGV